ncbi:hypothetical protein CWS72_11690, partial [Telmatospirillum siberiense]
MSFYENMKISAKVITLLAILGLFVVAATVFMAGKMYGIDATYSVLLTKDAKGAVTMMRLNSRVLDTSRLMYLLIAENDTAKMSPITKELDETAGTFRKYVADGKLQLPRKSAELDGILNNYETALKASQDIRAKALANDNDAAVRMMRELFAPPMEALRVELRNISVQTLGDLETSSAMATEETGTTVRVTSVVIAIGLAVVLGLSVVLTRVYLSKPIVAMGEVMHRLADRDYAVVVHGANRRDEVGVMAKAVQVFKEGMIRADEAAAQQERDRQEREQRARKIEAMTREFDGAVSAI